MIYTVLFNIHGRLVTREILYTKGNTWDLEHRPGFVRILSRRPITVPATNPRAPYGHFAGAQPPNNRAGRNKLPRWGDGYWLPKYMRGADRANSRPD